MSYHILHQFDEQWFAENGQDSEQSRPDGFFRRLNKLNRGRQSSLTTSLPRPWLIVGASLMIAALALYYAMDARRQAIDLQQRLTNVESKLKK